VPSKKQITREELLRDNESLSVELTDMHEELNVLTERARELYTQNQILFNTLDTINKLQS